MRAGYLKFGTLREIAVRQIVAGNKAAAARTLQRAMDVSDEDEQFRVMRMADIAWEQIRMEDRIGAEETIAKGLRKNEGQGRGSDQVNGWMILAEDLAYMGEHEWALGVANKIKYADIRARALQLVAYHETGAGHGDWAISWAKGIDDPEGRARTFLGIAAGLIEQITACELC